MLEKDVMGKLNRAMRKIGYWPITQTDATRQRCRCGSWVTFYPPKGRPDTIQLHPTGLSVVIECKVLKNETSFPFSRINQDQRDWLDNWAEDGGKGFIGLGNIVSHGKTDRLEGLWLVPWLYWIAYEDLVRHVQVSLPLNMQCRSRELREKELYIERALKSHALTEVGGGEWEVVSL